MWRGLPSHSIVPAINVTWLTRAQGCVLTLHDYANGMGGRSSVSLNCYVAGTFIALQYLVCLTFIFLSCEPSIHSAGDYDAKGKPFEDGYSITHGPAKAG